MANPQEYSRIRAMYNGSAAYVLAEEPVLQERNDSEEHLAPRPKKAVQTAYGLSAFAIVGYVAVALVMVLVLMTYVQYTQAAAETIEYRERIETLSEEQRTLTIKYEQTFDLIEVEAYATTVLGMDKPREAQIGQVSLNASDKAVIYDDGNTGFLGGIAAVAASVMEYFG